jgi:hypothetical protein
MAKPPTQIVTLLRAAAKSAEEAPRPVVALAKAAPKPVLPSAVGPKVVSLRAGVPNPSPEDPRGVVERGVQAGENILDVAETAMLGSRVAAAGAGVVPALAVAAPRVAAVNRVSGRVAVPLIAGLTAADVARTSASPAYREQTRQAGEDAANRVVRGGSAGQAMWDAAEYTMSRPAATGQWVRGSLGRTHTENLNSQLRAERASRRAEELRKQLRRMESAELMRRQGGGMMAMPAGS